MPPMKFRIPRPSLSMAIGLVALLIALGGTSAAAVVVSNANNAKHLGGQPPSFYLQSRHFAYSHGERFFSAGQTVTLGTNGHFTFTSTCSKVKRTESGHVRCHGEHDCRSRRQRSDARWHEDQYPYRQRRA